MYVIGFFSHRTLFGFSEIGQPFFFILVTASIVLICFSMLLIQTELVEYLLHSYDLFEFWLNIKKIEFFKLTKSVTSGTGLGAGSNNTSFPYHCFRRCAYRV